jgi:hypothetical protein
MSGHVPELLGTWGLSTISLGKSVIQERQSIREEFVWVGTTVRKGKKEILELVRPWRENSRE